MIDDSYRFVYVNDEMMDLLGYTAEEMIGMDFRKVVAEEDLDMVADRYRRRQRGEDVPGRYELSVVRKNGEKREMEMTSTVIRYKDAVRSMGQLLDITHRKKTERALQESERLLRESQAVAHIGSYFFTVKTGTWICSPALNDIFGIDDDYSKDVEGWLNLVHP